MLETMRWVQWLEVEQRHLVWMRAKRYGWRDITIRFACDRTTAWRRCSGQTSPTNSTASSRRSDLAMARVVACAHGGSERFLTLQQNSPIR
jgi:hypothetical protein